MKPNKYHERHTNFSDTRPPLVLNFPGLLRHCHCRYSGEILERELAPTAQNTIYHSITTNASLIYRTNCYNAPLQILRPEFNGLTRVHKRVCAE